MPIVGTARSPVASATDANRPRPVCPITRPTGNPISAATARPIAEYHRCWINARTIPPVPHQWSGSSTHRTPSTKSLTGISAAPRA